MALKLHRRPTPLRMLAGAMLLIEIAAFFYASRLLLVNLILGMAVVLGVAYPWKWNPDRDRRYVIALLLTLPFILWWFFTLRLSETNYSLILNANLSVAMAAYAIALQLLQLFLRHKQTLPLVFPLIGVFALCFAGDVQIQGQRSPFYELYLAFAFLAAFYFLTHYHQHRAGSAVRQHRMRYYLLLALVLLSSIGLGYPTAHFLEWAEDGMSTSLLNKLVPDPKIGWQKKNTSTLNSMPKLHGEYADTILARIYADTAPGYLRGQVFDSIDSLSWKSTSTAIPIAPERALPEGLSEIPHNEKLFALVPPAEATYTTAEIWPEECLAKAILAPHTTAWLGSRAETIERDPWGVAEVDELAKGLPYHLFIATQTTTAPLSPEDHALFTAMPGILDARIAALAQNICGSAQSASDKAAAISGYFRENYQYQLGITIPDDEAALNYFLFNDPLPAAHCEFFAAATAILLRSVGVPARYVTGVMAWEKAPLASYWIARNRDAHAWVEAWDPELGWFIVESTPESGLPDETTVTRKKPIREFFAAIWFQLKRLWGLLTQGEWREALAALITTLLTFLKSAVGIVALLLLLSGLGWLLLHKRTPKNTPETEALPPRIQTLRKLLTEMDRRTARKGDHRAPHETPHAFADKLEGKEATATWYRRWAQARFGKEEDDDAKDLEDKMH